MARLTWVLAVTGPRTTSLPLAEAARALTLLERGENIGKLVLVP